MLATPAPLPSPAEDRQWAYEVKWDGVRAVAYLQDGHLRLMSRTDRDITSSYVKPRWESKSRRWWWVGGG